MRDNIPGGGGGGDAEVPTGLLDRFSDLIGKNWTYDSDLAGIITSFHAKSLGNGVILVTSAFGYVNRSEDYCLTWDYNYLPQTLGVIEDLGSGVALITMLAPPYLFKTTDYGRSAYPVTGYTGGSSLYNALYLGKNVVCLGAANNHIYRSTDYGDTYADLGVKLVSGGFYGSCNLGDGKGLMGDSTHIQRTTDWGANWTDLGAILTGLQCTQPFINFGDGIVVVLDSTNVRRSTDWGATWTDLGALSAVNLYCSAFLGYDTAIIGDVNGHVFRTTDKGLNWTDLGDITGSNDPLVAMVYAGEGIAVTIDENRKVYRSVPCETSSLAVNDFKHHIENLSRPRADSFVINGLNGVTKYRTIQKYDDLADSYAYFGSAIYQRQSPGSFVTNGFIFIAGGDATGVTNSVERIDPLTGFPRYMTILTTGRDGPAGFAINEKGFVIGGDEGGCVPPAKTRNEMYSFLANAWTAKAVAPGDVYYSGSFDLFGYGFTVGESANKKTYKYDIIANAWETKGDLSSNRSVPACFAFDGYGFAAGDGTAAKIFDRYDDETETWTNKADMPANRYNGCGTAQNNQGYYHAGYNGAAYVTVPYRYDNLANAWTTKAGVLPQGVTYCAAAEVGRIEDQQLISELETLLRKLKRVT